MTSDNTQPFYPLSPLQKDILFHTLSLPQSGAYLCQVSMSLQKSLNIPAFQQAWQQLINRHSVLRTVVDWQDNTHPIQRVHQSVNCQLHQLDWSHYTLNEYHQKLEAYLAQDRQTDFDLNQPPLMRLMIFHHPETKYQFVWTIHRILIDNGTIQILLQEVITIYQAIIQNNPVTLPVVQPFTTYTTWLETVNFKQSEFFWREYLAGFVTPTTLPLPAPLAENELEKQINQTTYITHQHPLSSELTDQIATFTQTYQISFQTLLQAVWALLLSRYNREDDVVFGVVHHTQPPELTTETSICIGLFANILPQRITAPTKKTIITWLSDIQAQSEQLKNHQHTPLAQVQGWSELSATQPMFETVINTNRASLATILPNQVDSTYQQIKIIQKTNYPFFLEGYESPVTTLIISYDPNYFDQTYINAIPSQLQQVLTQIVTNPQALVTSLSLLPPTDAQQILHTWNQTQQTYLAYPTLMALFEAQVQKTPHNIALFFNDQMMTYQTLNERANQLAYYLQTLGVGPEILVGVYIERSLEMVISLYAILKAGGAYVPLDPHSPAERLEFMLQDANISILLTQHHLISQIPQPLPPHLINLDVNWDVIAQYPVTKPKVVIQPDNLAYAIYTSGSTGKPKSAMNSHRAIINRLLWMQEKYTLNANDRVLQKTPFTFDVSVWEFFWPLFTGATLVVAKPEGHKDSAYLVDTIQSKEITTIHFVPSMLQMFLEQANVDACYSLRQVICSGEALPFALQTRFFDRLNATLHNLYGPTEAAVDVTYWACDPDTHLNFVPIGQPIANIQLYVVDEYLHPVPVGVPGELLLGGIGLGRGYLRRPALTAEKFIPNPFKEDGSRLYRTGDLVRYLPDGNLEFLGRIDFQVKIRGLRIELGEIETALQKHEAIKEVVVVVKQDNQGEKHLIAYCIYTTNTPPTTGDLRRFLSHTLPDYMLPTYFVPMETFPLTSSGKLNRRALPAPDFKQFALNQQTDLPRNAFEEMILQFWREALQLPHIGIHHNFFELGGHSLMATPIIVQLSDLLGYNLPLNIIFEKPTVAELASYIDELITTGALLQDEVPLVPVLRQQQIPLSYSQQQLWFLDQLIPHNVAYNLPIVLSLKGKIDLSLLKVCLTEIGLRHESLRTTFTTVAGEPRQTINPEFNLLMPVVDLSDRSLEKGEIEARQLAHKEVSQPFDLNQGPLFRAKILRLADQTHLLVFTFHHIISDGWSLSLFLQELSELYQAAIEERSPELPQLSVQYADYTVWEQRRLATGYEEKLLAYWRQQLAEAPQILEMPTDYPRLAEQRFAGDKVFFTLDEPLTTALKKISQRMGVTLFMTLLTGFGLLLSRYSHQDEVMIGVPKANRNWTEVKDVIGFFVNMLPLRIDVSGQPSIQTLLKRVGQMAVQSYRHSELPFERLVQHLQPERSLSHSPIFQVMFTMQNIIPVEVIFPGVEVSELNITPNVASFDLTLSLVEKGNSTYHGFIEYNSDLFNRDTIERMVEHLQVLLHRMIENPQALTYNLSLLTENERHQLLNIRNQTIAPYPNQQTICHLFESQVQKMPDKIAFIQGEYTLTYQALNQQANQLAHYLRNCGVKPGVFVGIYLDRSWQMLVSLLGVLKVGGTYIPLDPTYPQSRLAFMIQDADIGYILTNGHIPNPLSLAERHVINLDDDWPEITQQPDHNLVLDLGFENIAYVIYTSGSTGIPKGVQISHKSLLNFLQSMSQSPGLGAEDKLVAVTTLSFDIAGLELYLPLMVGATLILASQEEARDGIALAALLTTHQATVLQATPATWQMLLATNWAGNKNMKMLCGGEGLPFSLAQHLLPKGKSLWNLYGPTETTIWSSLYQIEAQREQPTQTTSEGYVPIGRPIANTQLYVLDAYGQPVPQGVFGELYIGGDGVAQGYLNRPDLTAERFVPDPFSNVTGSRLYRTGDLVRYLPDGNLEFLRRMDDQVKVRGFRIELGEIEAVLNQHPAVNQAVVSVWEDSNKSNGFGNVNTMPEKLLVAYVLPEANQTLHPDTLREFIQARLPLYYTPFTFVTLDEFPLTPNKKINRRKLPAPDISSTTLNTQIVLPRSPIEEILAQIWQELLGLTQVSIYDDFFKLGGHSLIATRVVSRLGAITGLQLPVSLLFETPTIAYLGNRIQSLLGQNDLPEQIGIIEPMPRTGPIPLSYNQQQLWFLDQLLGENAAYNIPLTIHLHGPLNVNLLAKSLHKLIERHESLRTIFAEQEGEPTQIIVDTISFSLPVVNLIDMAKTEKMQTVEQQILEEISRSFNLETGPLFRGKVWQLDQQEFILTLTVHHIVADGWSINILLKELSQVYQALSDGQPAEILPLPIQYADFVMWQRNWLTEKREDNLLTYWRKQLQNHPERLELPTDYPRPAMQSFQGNNIYFEADETLTDALNQLSQQQGVTLFMTLLASFAMLLAKYSGQTDIVIGSPVANRHRTEIESLIGFFVNTLPLRINPTISTFEALLEQVRAVTLGAYNHQSLPLGHLVEELQPERHLSYSPLFQTVFVLQNFTPEIFTLPQITNTLYDFKPPIAKFDLSLVIEEVVEELTNNPNSGPRKKLKGRLEYNTDLFNQTTIERLAQHLLLIWQKIVINPQEQLLKIPLLTDLEQKEILGKWVSTQAPYPQQCIHQLIEIQAQENPQAIAVTYEADHLTYEALNQKANQLAHYLHEQGVGPEVVVGLCVERSLDLIIGMLGILKAGGAYVPLDPAYPSDRLIYMLTDAQCVMLLTQQSVLPQLHHQSIPTLYLDKDWSVIANYSTLNLNKKIIPDNLAYILYTSGSTGRPKGVQISHRGLSNIVQAQREVFQLKPNTRALQFASFSFDASVSEITLVLPIGGTICLAPREKLLPGPALLDLLTTLKINMMIVTPSTLAALPFHTLPDLHTVCVAGEFCPPELVERWSNNRRFFNLYGPTEGTIWTTYARCYPQQTKGSIGRPIINNQVYLLDPYLQPVPIGVHGEIYIGGVGVARGYQNRPDLTAERFIPHPFSSQPETRLYKTGDIARYLPDGQIEFLGRIDHQVKIRGFRIETGEIENILNEHPYIHECLVIAREDTPGNKRLVAYFVPQTEHSTDYQIGELRNYLGDKLPDYMIPNVFVKLTQFPLTPNGKLDRKALPAPEIDRSSLETAIKKPRNLTEEILTLIWTGILDVEEVSIYDNFFELGGHSLLATRLISRLNDIFEVKLPVHALFEQSTVAGLAEQIETVLQEVGYVPAITANPIEPVSRDKDLPLSFAQQRLWFLDQLEGDSAAYNIPIALRLKGALNVSVLEESFSEIVRRHESLRTTFVNETGTPTQIINPPFKVTLPIIDLTYLTSGEQLNIVKHLATEEATILFNLQKGPLLRGKLLHLNEQTNIFLVTMHHIVADGWSMGIFLQELSTFYNAFLEKYRSPLPDLPIQYADFAYWQRNWLQGTVAENLLSYWREQLTGSPPMLTLPTDRPRPRVQTFSGDTIAFEIGADLAKRIKALCQQTNVTLFMMLLSTFATLLSHYSQQEDIVIGSPIANRNRWEVESLIGFFVNTLVLRLDLSGNPTFTALLERVREIALGAYTHQDLPFERLVEVLQPERSLSYTPLFQVLFTLQNTSSQKLELPGLVIETLHFDSITAKFDLSLTVEEEATQLKCHLEYNTDLFNQDTILRLAGHFHTLLTTIVEIPHQNLTELNLLTTTEKEMILHKWNDTRRLYASNIGLPALFEAQVERTPERIALIFEEQEITYNQLNQRANQLAHYLQKLGVGPETLVGICIERSIQMLIGLLGILKSGAAYLPLDPNFPPDRNLFVLQDAHVNLLLTSAQNLVANSDQPHETSLINLIERESTTLPKIIYLDTNWPEIALENNHNPLTQTQPNNMAYTIYTSGSTGQPKGVQISHRALLNFLETMKHQPGLIAEDNLLAVTTISFDIAGLEMYLPLIVGAKIVLASYEDTKDGRALIQLLNNHKITVMQATPATWQMLLLSGWQGNKQLKVLCGGEGLPTNLASTLLSRVSTLWNMYGPTETTIWSSIHQIQLGEQAHNKDEEQGLQRIGRPIANTQLYVLNHLCKPVPIGVSGELYIGGDGLARGYFNRPRLTAKKFVPNPFSKKPGARLYKTGDLARYRADGNLEFLGRLDYQIKLRGFRIELAEIETVLVKHPTLHEVVVTLHQEDPLPGENPLTTSKYLVAYVIPELNETPTSYDLRNFAQEKLPDYMIPSIFILLDSFPLTPNKKVDRLALPAPETVRPDFLGIYVPPQTFLEATLVDIWQRTLHLDRVGVYDNFFELGGHSLLMIELIANLNQAFDQNFPLRILFEAPTIKELATYIKDFSQ